MKPWWAGLIVMVGIVIGGNVRFAGANSCVTCHRQAETMHALPAWYQDQFLHWYGSVHGRAKITCDQCHGGAPAESEKKLAHQGIRPPHDPESPVHYKNLPETCGACHKGVYAQFTRSRHYKNLKTDRLAPTCTTCHGFQMDVQGVSLPLISGRCAACHHTPGGVKPEVADLARKIAEEFSKTQEEIGKAAIAIELAREQNLDVKEAQNLVETARDHLKKTGDLWHAFNLRTFREELARIQSEAQKANAAVKKALRGS